MLARRLMLALAVLAFATLLRLTPALVTSNPQKPAPANSHIPTYRIPLNHACTDQLRLLPGIGPALAQRIADHRHTIAGFHQRRQLRDIPGIGEVTYRRIAPWIRLAPPPNPAPPPAAIH